MIERAIYLRTQLQLCGDDIPDQAAISAFMKGLSGHYPYSLTYIENRVFDGKLGWNDFLSCLQRIIKKEEVKDVNVATTATALPSTGTSSAPSRWQEGPKDQETRKMGQETLRRLQVV